MSDLNNNRHLLITEFKIFKGFIAATKDSKIRAFDQDNGDLLWEAQLPYPGYATPSVYQIGGKEYVVIACGGGKLGSPSGDRYVAFSL
ncbi:MAG: hypothetical protein DA439_06390 [Bacteroidetes bacterium]|nr:MAG: hypothetical protein DA439_06390 [Bacteroidota bacterium]